MKKLLFILLLVGVSAVNAVTVNIINNTGQLLNAHGTFVGCNAAELKNIGAAGARMRSSCCFVGMRITAANGQSRVVTSDKNAFGIQMTCSDLTYVVSMPNGQLTVNKR